MVLAGRLLVLLAVALLAVSIIAEHKVRSLVTHPAGVPTTTSQTVCLAWDAYIAYLGVCLRN